MRYVRDTLVLRVYQELNEEEVDGLNAQFSDILVSGKIEQCAALPEERNEPELSKLPRLVLNFDRKQLGRLRMLINAINETCPTCNVSPDIH